MLQGQSQLLQNFTGQPYQQPRQSHQIKALIYKTATLQKKQYCTNVCQIITPIICLLFTLLIRKIAIQNLTTNQESIYNKLPPIAFKFNDYQFMNELKDIIFQFSCNRWYLYDWARDQDQPFIGSRTGDNQLTGMLSNILVTNKQVCPANESFAPPYSYSLKQIIPYFKNPHISINEELYSRYLYFNNMSSANINSTSSIDKMPDGAIFFNQANEQGLNVDIKINDLRSLELHAKNGITKIMMKDPQLQIPKYRPYYTITEGFLNTIDMLTTSFIQKLKQIQIVSGYLYMPATGNSSAFIETLVNIVSTIIFPLSLSLLLPVFLYNTVLEKETKIIQMMRINGLGIMTYWFVNFIFNFLVSLVTFVVFYAFGFLVIGNAFFVNTNPGLFWVILVGWALCQIGMSMFVQVFINNSRAANIIGYLLTIWTNLIGATLSVALYQYPVQMPFAVTLWPTIALNRLFYIMFIYCSSDRCFNSFSGLTNQVARCIVIIYASAIIFMLLGIYLFEIVPQQFGVKKNWFFPFTQIKHLLFKERRQVIEILNGEGQGKSESSQRDQLASKQKKKVYQNNFFSHALICKGLTKVYDNGKKATTDFNLIIEDNEVFGLLGPNGAGKTTLISMITGIFTPTVGTAYISGYSIKDQIDKVHMSMGVCPQFDILWDELTVEEHLYFYARLRGISQSNQKSKVRQTLIEIALEPFANFKVKQLSGGMKRRLSVAISLVGDPRIVFLDQPTTGLDPQNRRNLWQLLAHCKSKRSLFLTTHLMEQAESLCDRIGIITSSHLRTIGSKPQLKRIYGRGYNLTISVQIEKILFVISEDQQQSKQSKEENIENLQREDSEYSSSSSINYSFSRSSQIPIVANKMINDSLVDEEFLHNNQEKLNFRSLDLIKSRVLQKFGSNCSLVKQINGTLKYNLNSGMKISTALQNLQRMKQDSRNDKREQGFQFQWSINNPSLEDVFFSVVQKFQQKNRDQKNEQEF